MYLRTARALEVKISQGEVSYLRVGHGNPMVLIHGFGNHFGDWNSEFIERLSQSFELYLVNIRGVGKSHSKSSDSSFSSMARDIAEFATALNLEKIVVLGYSMGGYLAQEFAQIISPQLTGMILMSTRMGGRFRIMADEETLRVITKKYPTRAEELEKILPFLAPIEVHDKIRQHYKEVETYFDPQEIFISSETRALQNAARISWLEGFDGNYRGYQGFQFPTLILSGNEDRIFPFQNSIEMATEIPYSWLIRFPHGGHDLAHQFPKQISSLIFNFLENTRTGIS